MRPYSLILFLSGALTCAVLAMGSSMAHGAKFIALLEARTDAVLEGTITARFRTAHGWLTRHPVLSGGDALDDSSRARAATAVAELPGVGGATWAPSGRTRSASDQADTQPAPLHCQNDVEAILKARTIRFGEASAAIDPTSNAVLDEVAAALRPCVGSIIAITGHTDAAGFEGANVALSRSRAEAVRWALAGRGIPEDGLRASGVGSSIPVEGLDSADAANRRIEFSVIATMPLHPTPVDTPGPG